MSTFERDEHLQALRPVHSPLRFLKEVRSHGGGMTESIMIKTLSP